MSFTDSGDQLHPTEALEGAAENQSATTSAPAGEVAEPAGPPADQAAGQLPPEGGSGSSRRILIGSQRDPAAYRARIRRDWAPVDEGEGRKEEGGGRRKKRGERRGERGEGRGTGGLSTVGPAADIVAGQPRAEAAVELPPQQEPQSEVPPSAFPLPPPGLSPLPAQLPGLDEPPLSPLSSLPPPNLRDRLPADLEDELNRAMGDASMDELLGGSQTDQEVFEPDSLQTGRVVGIRRDDVFVEFSGRQQGIVSMRQFDVPPQPGTMVQVVVQRFNPEEEMYELSVPNKAVQVDDWSDLVEGAMIEVRVTGHNTGGLECEVNHIRGFIPISQVALYRVEDCAQFVDQRLTCVITESDPDRRNLVLSRRAVLEREREQLREQMLNSLQPGQVRDGVVRKLMDFGAFVDLGGVDGLLHVSQLAWGRVKHPSDVLHEGQAIKVRIDKVDPATGKISLAYRDLMESPWTAAAQKYPPHSVVRGTVTKLMEFGAFVELEPGIEGLIHISELSHKRVWRASDVVHEGDQVEVFVLSVDPEAQRMSLSMKALAAPPEPVKKEEAGEAAPAKASKRSQKPTGPLLGGISRRTGDRFGLKW